MVHQCCIPASMCGPKIQPFWRCPLCAGLSNPIQSVTVRSLLNWTLIGSCAQTRLCAVPIVRRIDRHHLQCWPRAVLQGLLHGSRKEQAPRLLHGVHPPPPPSSFFPPCTVQQGNGKELPGTFLMYLRKVALFVRSKIVRTRSLNFPRCAVHICSSSHTITQSSLMVVPIFTSR